MEAWRKDLLPGLAVLLLVGLIAAMDWLGGLERRVYDAAMSFGSHRPQEQVAVIAIDDASLSALGRWPWPRHLQAQLIEKLTAAGAKAIAYTVQFSEPQSAQSSGLVTRLRRWLQASSLPGHADAAVRADYLALLKMIEEWSKDLDGDQRFAQAIAQSRKTVLPMMFELGDPGARVLRPLPEAATRNAFAARQIETADGSRRPLPTRGALVPVDALAQAAPAIGFINLTPDDDGVVRALPLVLQYGDQSYPSLILALVVRALGHESTDLRLDMGEGLSLGKLRIPTDSSFRVFPAFARGNGEAQGFQTDSFVDALSGTLPPERYRDKIVLIGATAAGLSGSVGTPVAAAMPTVMVVANTLSSLLRHDYVTVPKGRAWVEWSIFVLVAAYVLFALPRVKPLAASLLTGALFILVLGIAFYSLIAQGLWLRLAPSALLLGAGLIAVMTVKYLFVHETPSVGEDQGAENSRMLGLAFQSQGQLDLAFDKFREVPLGRRMLDPLYNLALDFERKQEFGKAATVLKHLAGYDASFRDVKERLQRLAALADQGTEPLGEARRSLLGGTAEHPRLGRYEIEKELGKGAMGVVYLGRDSKIGRVVAIKTLELSREFDLQELAEVKSRFFREAETAGRLSHPNIVTIYDAGEEKDLAYIAMEFVKGQDLIGYTRPGHLLALGKVLEMMADIADALAYAHDHQVIHRDIKPANIMFEPDSGLLKVADFGIARISDASRTRTGMVLGTPSYMSPEQLGGRKIDGRADLYALGVTMYQLLCGHLPFEGGSMTELMYKIANDPPANILDYNAALPEAVVRLVNKMLAKRPEDRFQAGNQLSAALRECRAELLADVVDVGLEATP